MSEKRKFSRVLFTGQCLLNKDVSGEMETWKTDLLDISLKGALVHRPDSWPYQENTPVQLHLYLEGSDIVLESAGVICHQEEEQLGIKFLSLNLESITHLKRLIQLNLADETLLHREMSQLINTADK